jgi:two-component sensor histidine kinase
MIGQNSRLLRSTRHNDEFYANLWQSIHTLGVWQNEIWNKHKNGYDYLTLMTVNKVILNDGTKINFVATFVDITESKLNMQKRHDDEIMHRDLLVSEVHHRIKNNLQGVVGLLRNFSLDHPEFSVLINDAVSQIHTISIIHGLQGGTANSSVRLCELTKEIAVNNKSLYRTPIQIDIPSRWIPCLISEKEAVPLALVLNELIANAIKHGDNTIGVKISFRFETLKGRVVVTISNYGLLSACFEDNSSTITGKGLQLASSLLPKKGANLKWEQHGEFVHAVLELESPVFILENEE